MLLHYELNKLFKSH